MNASYELLISLNVRHSVISSVVVFIEIKMLDHGWPTLNFNNFPNQMISGRSLTEIQSMSNQADTFLDNDNFPSSDVIDYLLQSVDYLSPLCVVPSSSGVNSSNLRPVDDNTLQRLKKEAVPKGGKGTTKASRSDHVQ